MAAAAGSNAAAPPRKLDPDRDLENLTVVESMCPRCGENGTTRLLYTVIPHFEEVILASFECPHCGERNNQVQPAAPLAEKVVTITLHCEVKKQFHAELGAEMVVNGGEVASDLNRQLFKPESATLRIKELELEIPRGKGEITTVEGVLSVTADNLAQDQDARRQTAPEVAAKIDAVVAALREMSEGRRSFTLEIFDPAGNCGLENPYAPKPDPRAKRETRPRTDEEAIALGFMPEHATPASASAPAPAASAEDAKVKGAGEDDVVAEQERVKRSVIERSVAGGRVHVAEEARKKLETYFDPTKTAAVFQGFCPGCTRPCETRMCMISLPYFKETVIMVTDCEFCGYKDTNVQGAGSISPTGRRCTLTVRSAEDMQRDVLKSDNASMRVPEIDLTLQPGTLGGKYTTVEGLLKDVRNTLERTFAFALGDSAQGEEAERMTSFLKQIDELIELKRLPFTFIVDDTLGNVFIAKTRDDDPNLKVEDYERSWEQDEDLGLHDIRVDGYDGPALARVAEEAEAAEESKRPAPAAAAAAAAPAPPPEPTELDKRYPQHEPPREPLQAELLKHQGKPSAQRDAAAAAASGGGASGGGGAK